MFWPCVPEPDEIVMTRPHVRSHMPSMVALTQFQDAIEVDIDIRRPLAARQISELHRAHGRWDACIVDEDVDVAGGSEGAVHRVGIRDVERKWRGAWADFSGRGRGAFGHEVVDEDVSACGDEGVRDAEADAPSRAGDEGLSPGEVEHHIPPSRAGGVSSRSV